MQWLLLRITIKILAVLQITVNFFPLQLPEKILKLNIFYNYRLKSDNF